MGALLDFITKHIRFILITALIIVMANGIWGIVDGLVNHFYGTLFMLVIIIYGKSFKRYIMRMVKKPQENQ